MWAVEGPDTMSTSECAQPWEKRAREGAEYIGAHNNRSGTTPGTALPEPAGGQEILLTVAPLPQHFPFILAGKAFSSL